MHPWSKMEIVPHWQPEDGPCSLALTPHQREIALLIGQGLTNREIAAQLGTTPGSIGVQIGRIVRRLGLMCRADIVAWAVDHYGLDRPALASPLRTSRQSWGIISGWTARE